MAITYLPIQASLVALAQELLGLTKAMVWGPMNMGGCEKLDAIGVGQLHGMTCAAVNLSTIAPIVMAAETQHQPQSHA